MRDVRGVWHFPESPSKPIYFALRDSVQALKLCADETLNFFWAEKVKDSVPFEYADFSAIVSYELPLFRISCSAEQRFEARPAAQTGNLKWFGRPNE
jgi:hypothetical protein